MSGPASRRRIVHRLLRTATAALLLVPAAAPTIAQDPAPPPKECQRWADSGALDARFRIWACVDDDTGDAQADIAALADLVDQIWGPMTQPVPEGMGPPLPDGVGANVPKEYGGDGRIDFYLLRRGQAVFRDGKRSIPGTAYAASLSSGPFTTPDGAPRKGASGFVMVDRDRLPDTTKITQDLIHEFFHVLQYAHNFRAISQGPVQHWFVEASATWAETYYDRDENEDAHGWFPDVFQASDLGLEDADVDHQYSAYVWPLFMEQESGGPEAVFRAWQAIEPVASGDFAAVTAAIDAQLPFAQHFRDFAVRNLNNEALDDSEPRLPQYADLDLAFWDDVPPAHMGTGVVAPGEPWVSDPLDLPALSARYARIGVADDAREVTIDVRGVAPAGQIDGDVLIHDPGGTWTHLPVSGGVLKLCRDNPGEDLEALYLVISNHAIGATASGTAEVSAKNACKEQTLEGTFRWTTVQVSRISPAMDETITSTGSAFLVVRVDPTLGPLVDADSGSTYRYDYQRVLTDGACTPTHQEGLLEQAAQAPPAASGRGAVLLSAIPEELIDLTFQFVDVFTETCPGGIPTDVTPISPFQGCDESLTWAEGRYDEDARSYVFDCDFTYEVENLTVTSSVHGTLAPTD